MMDWTVRCGDESWRVALPEALLAGREQQVRWGDEEEAFGVTYLPGRRILMVRRDGEALQEVWRLQNVTRTQDPVSGAYRVRAEVVHGGPKRLQGEMLWALLARIAAHRPKPKRPSRIVSPITGKVVKVWATAGERYGEGASLAVIEAMKMENLIEAPFPLTVAAVGIVEGQAVQAGEVLLQLVPESEET